MVSKELRLFDYEKCVYDTLNAPIPKERASFIRIKDVIYTIANKKIAL